MMKRFSFFFLAAALLVASCSSPASKDVEVIAPYVTSIVSVEKPGDAWVTVNVALRNNTEEPVEGTLKCKLAGGYFEMPVGPIEAGETVNLAVDSKQMPGLHLSKASIWNTWDTGKTALYDLSVEFRTAEGLADEVKTTFGIRELSSRMDRKMDKALYLNGAQLDVRGVMLPEPEVSVLAKLQSLGFNTVRIPAEAEVSEEFLNECDVKGFIAMISLNGKSEEDILALRHHPCVLGWHDGEEGSLPEGYKSICLCCMETPAACYGNDAHGFYAYVGLPEEGEKEEEVRVMFESFRLLKPEVKGYILSAVPAGSQLEALKAASQPVQLIYNYADRQIWAVSDKGGKVGYEIKFSDAEGRPVDSIEGSVKVEAGVPAVAAAVPSDEVAVVEVALKGKSAKKYSL